MLILSHYQYKLSQVLRSLVCKCLAQLDKSMSVFSCMVRSLLRPNIIHRLLPVFQCHTLKNWRACMVCNIMVEHHGMGSGGMIDLQASKVMMCIDFQPKVFCLRAITWYCSFCMYYSNINCDCIHLQQVCAQLSPVCSTCPRSIK